MDQNDMDNCGRLLEMATALIVLLTPVVAAVVQARGHIVLLDQNTAKQSKDQNIVDRELSPKFSIGRFLFYRKLTMKGALSAAKKIAKDVEASKFDPTIIIGIGRGGSIFGSLISYNLYHAPIFSIDREYNWIEKRRDKILFPFDIPIHLTRRVLLVAGEAHTGGTMDVFTQYLKSIGAGEIKTCVFYKQNVCAQDINFWAKEGENTKLMPWQDAQSIRDSLSKAQANRLKKVQCQKDCPKVVYIVRHAETEENSDGDRFIGSTNTILSERGRIQAAQVADFLSKKSKIDLIYTSPLLRCLETAQAIQQKVGAPLWKDDDLREMDYGVWEGLQREVVKKRFPELYHKYEENPFYNYPEGGENPFDVQKRIERFWEKKILSLPNNANQLVVVTHKTAGRILLNNVIEGMGSSFRRKTMDNATVAKVNVKLGIAEVEYENNKVFLL